MKKQLLFLLLDRVIDASNHFHDQQDVMCGSNAILSVSEYEYC